mgnify:CR=1 FL=1
MAQIDDGITDATSSGAVAGTGAGPVAGDVSGGTLRTAAEADLPDGGNKWAFTILAIAFGAFAAGLLVAGSLLAGVGHGPSADTPEKLNVRFADPSWDGVSIPVHARCSRYGPAGASPELIVAGLPEGTRMVVDLSPVTPGTISDMAYTANGIVFIVRNEAALVEGFIDYSLWISNGFRDGTYPLVSSNGGDLPFGTTEIRPSLLGVVGSIAFYEFDGQIISTDGSVAGTRTIATNIDPAATLGWAV